LGWIDRAIQAQGLTEWSNQPTTAHLILSGDEAERFGVTEIQVDLNGKVGVATVYPEKGPQVFKWYNNKWNPTV
jgi:hypothetical protein